MGCGCGKIGKKPWPENAKPGDKTDEGTPVLRGSANPNYTWPPKATANGPSASKS